ncbi:hypothetical protein MYSI104531_21070 [Mycobacterium simiae]
MTAVEQGRARCPRCAAWAEYQFLELGGDRLEYQVHCGSCRHVYSEVSPMLAPGAAAA